MSTTRAADEGGFTLIELAFAIGVFGAVIIGLSFVFQGAFRTVNQVRYEDVARTLAQEKMEEIRSLPYFVSQKEEAADVDVLDRYFPNLLPPAYDGTAGTWSYTTTETIERPDAPDFTRRVTTQFIVATSAGGISPRAPRAGYDSNSATADEPATDAVKVVVTIGWTEAGEPRSIALDTVIARIEQEEPKVEASASTLAAQISGVTFQEGDAPGGPAELRVNVGDARLAFREVTGSTAQASSDPIQVVEADPATNVPLQPEGPTDGQTAATAPNSTTGNAQVVSANLAAGTVSTVDAPDGQSPPVIAAWGGASPSSTSASRVSALHNQNPESRAEVRANTILVNSRDAGEVEEPVLQLGSVLGVVEQSSTAAPGSSTGAAVALASVDVQPVGALPGVTIRGAPQFAGDARFEGVITIQSMHVDVESEAGSTTSSTVVNWRVDGLRVWDPQLDQPDGSVGGYAGPWTFGMRADCGGWVDDPNLCGPNRTDDKAQFENPNPVLIPPAYASGDEVSLSIVAGVTVQDKAANPSVGVSSASAGQKNILAITLRDDIQGAQPLEPMFVGLGDVSASVSYVGHGH